MSNDKLSLDASGSPWRSTACRATALSPGGALARRASPKLAGGGAQRNPRVCPPHMDQPRQGRSRISANPSGAARAFTLIEILLASIAAALILAAMYGVFQHAIQLRDSATQRVGDSRLRSRAAAVIRNDLRNAYISGGLLASIVQGDSSGNDGLNSDYPGYLKFTTTTGKDDDSNLYGDVQQVEYYMVRDASGAGINAGGDLVRAVTRDLVDAQTQAVTPTADIQQILTGVQSFEVSFFDGSNWQTSWEYNTSDNSSSSSSSSSSSLASSNSSSSSSSSSGSLSTSGSETLPVAIRVDIQQVGPANGGAAPPPIEILVPWTTQPFTSPTPSPSASPT